MNPAQFLAHFDRISEAPHAVPRLRRFILDLAVRGKLVEQDPNDEPASKLRSRIAADVQRRTASGDFSEPRKAIDLPLESLPFGVPSSWEWARLIELADVSYGCAFESARFNQSRKGMPLIRIRDISGTDTEAYYDGPFGDVYRVEAGDYLVGMDGDFNVRRWKGPAALLNQRVMRMRGWRAGLVPEFLTIPLQIVLDHLHEATSQTTVKHLSAKQVNGISLPLPPVAEQHRIVAKVDELMALCDRLEAAQTEREARRDRLVRASLNRLDEPAADNGQPLRDHARFHLRHLPRLTTRPEHIQQLRQTILNLAVGGEFVERLPGEEPAHALLSSLGNGVVAGSGHQPPVGAAKRSATDPEDVGRPVMRSGWRSVQLGAICSLVTSGSRGWAEYYASSGPSFIRAQNIRFGKLLLDDLACVSPPRGTEGSRTRVSKGDLLVVITGAGVTNPALLDRDLGEAYVSQHVALVRPVATEMSRWLLLCLMAPAAARGQLIEAAYGAGKPGLNLDNLRSLALPLPPLAEQHRIVAKVDELMALCGRLEAQLTTAQTGSRCLLEAFLHQALAAAA